MIHWPDWTIAGTLCGFDADPMQGRATCVALVENEEAVGGVAWSVGHDAWWPAASIAAAQRAAAAALGEGTT